MTDSPEVDAIVAELERAGLVTIGRDAEGRETWTLTPEGAAVARALAMSGEAGAAGADRAAGGGEGVRRASAPLVTNADALVGVLDRVARVDTKGERGRAERRENRHTCQEEQDRFHLGLLCAPR
jgi:hypothetical protein